MPKVPELKVKKLVPELFKKVVSLRRSSALVFLFFGVFFVVVEGDDGTFFVMVVHRHPFAVLLLWSIVCVELQRPGKVACVEIGFCDWPELLHVLVISTRMTLLCLLWFFVQLFFVQH